MPCKVVFDAVVSGDEQFVSEMLIKTVNNTESRNLVLVDISSLYPGYNKRNSLRR